MVLKTEQRTEQTGHEGQVVYGTFKVNSACIVMFNKLEHKTFTSFNVLFKVSMTKIKKNLYQFRGIASLHINNLLFIRHTEYKQNNNSEQQFVSHFSIISWGRECPQSKKICYALLHAMSFSYLCLVTENYY
jgi:hypothetical protein